MRITKKAKKEAQLKEEYHNLVIITTILSILLVLIIVLFIIGIQAGWFGEPGKIYLSPDKGIKGYVSCLTNENICINYPGTSCKEVTITTEYSAEFNKLCLKR